MSDQGSLSDSLRETQQQAILEIYRERYEHVRHAQQMRATYFNLYLVVVTGGVGVLTTLFQISQQSRTPTSWEAMAAVGFVIWAMSLLTMMRAERWGGHISHDLRVVRRIHGILTSQYPTISEIIPGRPRALAFLEFDRPLWSRDRSIESTASMIGALLGLLIVAFALPFVIWAQWLIIIFGILFTAWQWRAEVAHLKQRHADCCIRIV